MRSPAGNIRKVCWCFPVPGLGKVYVRIGFQTRTEAVSVQSSPLKSFPLDAKSWKFLNSASWLGTKQLRHHELLGAYCLPFAYRQPKTGTKTPWRALQGPHSAGFWLEACATLLHFWPHYVHHVRSCWSVTLGELGSFHPLLWVWQLGEMQSCR